MKTTCPHCSRDLDLNAETHELLRDAKAFDCPFCSGQVLVPPTPASLAVAPLKTQEEIGNANSFASDTCAVNHARLRIWHGTHRNFRILGALALLVLGGIIAFVATRKDGETFNDRIDLRNREVHNEYFKSLIESGATTAQDLVAVSDIHAWGTSLVGMSREAVSQTTAGNLAKSTASEVLEISDEGTGRRLAEWLAETWPDQLGHTIWIRQSGQMKVIDSPDIGTVTTPDRPRRVFLMWKNARPGGWSWNIDPSFDEALPFATCGLARVRVGKEWGLINQGGHFVQKPFFDTLADFSEQGCAKASRSGKWGLVDTSGKLVAKPEWDDVQDQINGFTPVMRDGKWGYLDADGKLATPCDWDDAWRFSPEGFAVVTRGGKRGFIDKTGKVIVQPEWDGALNFTKEGVGAVRRGNGWGLVDSSGKLLCEPTWQMVWKDRRFDLGFIPVWTQEGGKRYSLLGMDGKPLVTGDYDKMSKRDKGVVLSKDKGESILVGADGKIHFKIQGKIGQFKDGIAYVSNNDLSSAGFIDEEGRKTNPKASQSAGGAATELAAAKSNGKWGFKDGSGKFVVKPEWDEVRPFEKGFAAVRRGALWGFVDSLGKIVAAPAWKEVGRFSDGLAAVLIDSQPDQLVGVNRSANYPYHPPIWQFIDGSGKVAFDTKGLNLSYGKTPEFKDGFVEAYDSGKRVRVDTKGRRMILWREGAGMLPDGLAISQAERLGNYWNRHGDVGVAYSLMDQTDTEVMPDVNPSADFTNDYIPYALPPKYGLMDKTGKVWLKPTWDEARILSADRVWFRMGKKCGLADGTGKTLIQPLWDDLEVLSVDSGSLGDDGKSVVLGTEGTRILSPWVRVRDGDKTLILRPDGQPAIPESLAAEYVDFYGPDHLVITQLDAQGGRIWSVYEPATGKQTKFPAAATFRWNWNTAGFGVLWMQDKISNEWRLMDQHGGYLGHSQPAEQKPDGWCFVEGRAILQKPDGWVLIDPEGKVIYQGKAEVPRDFHEGRAAVLVNGKWGFIGLDGTLACQALWDEVGDFHHGFAAVKANTRFWGFIDSDGKLVVQPVWDKVQDFTSAGSDPLRRKSVGPMEVALVYIGNSLGCIDSKGRLIIEPGSFRDSHQAIRSHSGLLIEHDRITGKDRLTGWQSDAIDDNSPDGWNSAGRHINWEQVDEEGRRLGYNWKNRRWEFQDNGEPVRKLEGMSYSFRENDQFGWLPFDENGEPIAKSGGTWGPPWYDPYQIDPFSGDLISARTKEQKYGLLRRDGKLVVPPQYDRIAWVAPGVAAVWNRNTGGLMNRDGAAIYLDNTKNRIARFGTKNAKHTDAQHRRGPIIIEDTPKWGYAKLNR